MRSVIFVFGCLFCLVTRSALGADGVQTLQSFSKGFQSMAGDFVCRQSEGKEQTQQIMQKGRFAFERSGRFYWEVKEPAPQTIVSDAKHIWLYDPDLNQVTVRTVGTTLGATPVAVFSGRKELTELFEMESLGSKDGLDWVSLRPKKEDMSVRRMRIGFDAQVQPRRLIVSDHFSTDSEYEFSHLEINGQLNPSLFVFVPPKGVEVLEDKTQAR